MLSLIIPCCSPKSSLHDVAHQTGLRAGYGLTDSLCIRAQVRYEEAADGGHEISDHLAQMVVVARGIRRPSVLSRDGRRGRRPTWLARSRPTTAGRTSDGWQSRSDGRRRIQVPGRLPDGAHPEQSGQLYGHRYVADSSYVPNLFLLFYIEPRHERHRHLHYHPVVVRPVKTNIPL